MILTSPKLLTIGRQSVPIDNGAVLITWGTIQAVGPMEKIKKKYPGHRVYHFPNSVLMPGLVNLHTHLELPPLLETIRAKTFPEWILNLIQAKKNLSSDNYEVAAKQNIQTLIQTGTTTVGEICTHDKSPRILREAGLRAIIFNEVISMNQSGVFPLTLILSPTGRGNNEKIISSVRKGNNKSILSPSGREQGKGQFSPLIGISPHSPYTVSEPVLQKIKSLARKRNIMLCMHVAESKDEIKLLQRKKNGLEKIYQLAGWNINWAPSGSSSFEYLNRIGILSPNLLAVHAVQVTDGDIALIKKFRVPIAHCPRSNNELGVGKLPLKKFLDAGITVGLGTDSLASSPSLNMWGEMRYALRMHKRDAVSAQDIFKLATIGGAKALGLDKEIGTIEPGKKADIIAVPLPTKNTGDIYSDLLRETKSCIMSVVNGKILYGHIRHRKHKT